MGSRAPRMRVLVVDDSQAELERCAEALRALEQTEIVPVARSRAAVERLESENFDLLITDLRMPAVNGIELARLARTRDPEMPVIVLTGYPSVRTAVDALKVGAVDYLTKPPDAGELVALVERLLEGRRLRSEHRLLQRHLGRPHAFGEMVGESGAMRDVVRTIARAAEADLDVLIVGETGTGKELVARCLHMHGARRAGRFVPVDCGAIPENLLERELFGHERGAFTGAHARSTGLLEYADGGTFFLDEVTALPPPLQAKLLRVLQERAFRRLGGTREISVDARVVAATNRHPERLVEEGAFREDLYYRLNVVRIELPPLRDRREDIPLLARHLIRRHAERTGKPGAEISDEAIEVLLAYEWPGNVRQLENVLRRAMAMGSGDVIRPAELPDEVAAPGRRAEAGARAGVAGGLAPEADAGAGEPSTFLEIRARRIEAFERRYLAELLARFQGDVASAAEEAGLARGSLYRLLKKHGLAAGAFRAGP